MLDVFSEFLVLDEHKTPNERRLEIVEIGGSWSARLRPAEIVGNRESNSEPETPSGPNQSSTVRAMACKDRPHRRHSWHSRQCDFCNLQNLKDRPESESHSLRHP